MLGVSALQLDVCNANVIQQAASQAEKMTTVLRIWEVSVAKDLAAVCLVWHPGLT